MTKVAVVYWSDTGNTETMAHGVEEGVREAGADVALFAPDEFSAEMIDDFDAIAFGCPAMGSEELEDTEFEPMFGSLEQSLSDKNIALFGSYDWGEGQWMEDWEERCEQAGANLVIASVIVNLEPDDDALDECRKLGVALAS